MEKIIEFLSNNWGELSVAVLWLFVRLVPTKKNYDVVEGVLKIIGKLIPNKRKEIQ